MSKAQRTQQHGRLQMFREVHGRLGTSSIAASGSPSAFAASLSIHGPLSDSAALWRPILPAPMEGGQREEDSRRSPCVLGRRAVCFLRIRVAAEHKVNNFPKRPQRRICLKPLWASHPSHRMRKSLAYSRRSDWHRESSGMARRTFRSTSPRKTSFAPSTAPRPRKPRRQS
jgi:hypothetical protein